MSHDLGVYDVEVIEQGYEMDPSTMYDRHLLPLMYTA